MPAAAEIVKPLYPHQQEALAWMVNQREHQRAATFLGTFCVSILPGFGILHVLRKATLSRRPLASR